MMSCLPHAVVIGTTTLSHDIAGSISINLHIPSPLLPTSPISHRLLFRRRCYQALRPPLPYALYRPNIPHKPLKYSCTYDSPYLLFTSKCRTRWARRQRRSKHRLEQVSSHGFGFRRGRSQFTCVGLSDVKGKWRDSYGTRAKGSDDRWELRGRGRGARICSEESAVVSAPCRRAS